MMNSVHFEQEGSVRPIIGMEVHVQLATRTKLFCGCAVEFGAPPNSRMCPVCLGMPGVLPVLNRQAFDLAVILGLALNCRIAPFTKWDRKSYFYPDLPKNYQISQYDLPLASDGAFEIDVAGRRKQIRIRRAHLEEDAGKNIHDQSDFTLVDLNRAGTPLVEIVTEPDLNSAEEAYVFATELQRLVTYLGISEGVMQKGQMRFEPNVNVAISVKGQEFRTPISEIKNLNSFKAVRGAIEYEIRRQTDEWRRDPGYQFKKRPNENRGWDDQLLVTEFQRDKEAAHDYRYFPDPDLVPATVEEVELHKLRQALPELPLTRRDRFMRQCGISASDADVLVADRETADWLDEALAAVEDRKTLANQVIHQWLPMVRKADQTLARSGITPQWAADLASLVSAGAVNTTTSASMMSAQFQQPASRLPSQIAAEQGLLKVRDVGQLEAWVRDALAANPQAVQEILAHSKKAKASEGFLRGAVMKLSGGKADPKLAGDLIAKAIEAMRR